MSTFCLGGKSFNEDRNHHQYTIGIALRELMRKKIDIISHAGHHVYTRTKKERRVIG